MNYNNLFLIYSPNFKNKYRARLGVVNISILSLFKQNYKKGKIGALRNEIRVLNLIKIDYMEWVLEK